MANADASPSSTDQPPPANPERAGFRRRLVAAGQIATAVTALVTAALLIWNLVLKPSSPPPVLRAHITQVRIFPGISLHNYLDSHPGTLSRFLAETTAAHLPREDLAEALKTPGVRVEFSVEIEGGTHRVVHLTRTVYDLRTEARVPEGFPHIVLPQRYIPPTETYRSTDSTWVPFPEHRGTYFVEIDLLEPRGETLATGRSRAFSSR